MELPTEIIGIGVTVGLAGAGIIGGNSVEGLPVACGSSSATAAQIEEAK